MPTVHWLLSQPTLHLNAEDRSHITPPPPRDLQHLQPPEDGDNTNGGAIIVVLTFRMNPCNAGNRSVKQENTLTPIGAALRVAT
jgi:hypothetical protein